jgi:hypothetical protein
MPPACCKDVGRVLRATDRPYAPELGEFDRADAEGQGRGRAQGGFLVTRADRDGSSIRPTHLEQG